MLFEEASYFLDERTLETAEFWATSGPLTAHIEAGGSLPEQDLPTALHLPPSSSACSSSVLWTLTPCPGHTPDWEASHLECLLKFSLGPRVTLCPHRTNQNKTQTHSPSEQPVMQADSVAPSACGVTGERTGGAVREVRPACAEEVKWCPRSGHGGRPGGAGCPGAGVILKLVKCRQQPPALSDCCHVTENLVLVQTDCQKLLCETASGGMELWSGSGDHLAAVSSPGRAFGVGSASSSPLCWVPPFSQNRVLCLLRGPGRVPAALLPPSLSLSPAESHFFLCGAGLPCVCKLDSD